MEWCWLHLDDVRGLNFALIFVDGYNFAQVLVIGLNFPDLFDFGFNFAVIDNHTYCAILRNIT